MTDRTPDIEGTLMDKTNQVPAQTELESGKDGKQPKDTFVME